MRIARCITVALLVAGIVAAGCSSGRDRASTSAPASKDALVGAGGAAGGDTGAASAASAGNASSVVPDAAVAGPRVVKKADLTVDVRRNALRTAVDRATSIAERRGGYIASTATSRGDRGSTGTLIVRVPAAQFDAARRELSALGPVKDERLSGDDVTAELVDYAARITSLQAQEDALRTLMGRANAVGEVLQVHGQLFDARRQIEQLQGRQKALADAADVSTITLRLTEPGAPGRDPTEARTGLARSVDRAWDAAVAVVGAFIVVVGVAAPLAALALLAWFLWHVGLPRVRPRGAARAR